MYQDISYNLMVYSTLKLLSAHLAGVSEPSTLILGSVCRSSLPLRLSRVRVLAYHMLTCLTLRLVNTLTRSRTLDVG